MARNSKSWPKDRCNLLAAFWSDGLSASQIAGEMHVSRCAILGKAHRMGLQDRAPTPVRFKHGYTKPVPVVKPPRPPKAKVLVALKPGQSKTGPEYRRQFCGKGQLTKSQLLAQLTQAVTNTAAMQTAEVMR